jgi:hypothetical protein
MGGGGVVAILYIRILKTKIIQYGTVSLPIVCVLSVVK